MEWEKEHLRDEQRRRELVKLIGEQLRLQPFPDRFLDGYISGSFKLETEIRPHEEDLQEIKELVDRAKFETRRRIRSLLRIKIFKPPGSLWMRFARFFFSPESVIRNRLNLL